MEQFHGLHTHRTEPRDLNIHDTAGSVLIGVAPVKPSEFVIFRITQMPRGSEVAE